MKKKKILKKLQKKNSLPFLKSENKLHKNNNYLTKLILMVKMPKYKKKKKMKFTQINLLKKWDFLKNLPKK